MTGALGDPSDDDEPEPEQATPWPASEFELFPCPNCGVEDWAVAGTALHPETPETVFKQWSCRECGADLQMHIDIDPERNARRREHLHRDVDC